MVQFLPVILSAAQQLGQAQQRRNHETQQALTLGSQPNQYQVQRNSQTLPGLINMGKSLGWGNNNLTWDNL
jgi:hypothetical protein